MKGVPLVAGEARGPLVSLTAPLSFWGGFSAETGTIIDEHHPQNGLVIAGKIVAMSSGRGSSSASSVLAEAARLGTAPRALIVAEPDDILATGAIVADELYDRALPIVVVSPEMLDQLRGFGVVAIDATGGIATFE